MDSMQLTRDEIIDELMDEWWTSLDEETQNKLIDEYCNDIGAEITGG
jgi:hypothetical protein